jgi:hypothetical protein
MMRPLRKDPAVFNRRNRALQVSVVKTSKNDTTVDAPKQCSHRDPEQIAEIAKDFVTHTAKAVGAVIITYAVSTAFTRLVDNLSKNTESE